MTWCSHVHAEESTSTRSSVPRTELEEFKTAWRARGARDYSKDQGLGASRPVGVICRGITVLPAVRHPSHTLSQIRHSPLPVLYLHPHALSLAPKINSSFGISSGISCSELPHPMLFLSSPHHTPVDTAETTTKPPSSPAHDKDTPLDDSTTSFSWPNFKVQTAHSLGAGCLYSMRMWRSRRAASLVQSQYHMPY
ncbi:hypothetical protein BC629DRAFT_962190 [Irpex lacteus]|nr:hypothetical protein BC629DRAFT_962190 [Irpex lacteus]